MMVMLRAVRWVFVTGPVRAYKRGEATGRVPWLHMLAITGLMVVGGVLGAGVGRLVGADRDGVQWGIAVGGGVAVVWFLWTLVLVAVMRLRGRPLGSLRE